MAGRVGAALASCPSAIRSWGIRWRARRYRRQAGSPLARAYAPSWPDRQFVMRGSDAAASENHTAAAFPTRFQEFARRYVAQVPRSARVRYRKSRVSNPATPTRGADLLRGRPLAEAEAVIRCPSDRSTWSRPPEEARIATAGCALDLHAAARAQRRERDREGRT